MIGATLDIDQITAAVSAVVDPEIPVLTIEDLGILRSVGIEEGTVIVTITPTYSGCPAMGQIEDDIRSALLRLGVERAEVMISHSPPWSTDWMGERARRKLGEFGIAPPVQAKEVLCPVCDANDPRLVARFGSTACKALMVCTACGDPFDWFKEFR